MVQAINRGPHISAVATSAFRMENQPAPKAPHSLDYDSVVLLWENNSSTTLRTLFHLSETFPLHDKVEIVKAGTGMEFFILFFILFLFYFYFIFCFSDKLD